MKLFKYLFAFFYVQIAVSQIAPVTNFSTQNILPHNTVRSLLFTKDKTLWIGTDNGLVKKFNSSIVQYFEEDGLPMNNIWALAEDEKNQIWIGSYGNGIAAFNGEKFMGISAVNGLIHNEITVLFADKNLLYIGTSDGISILNINEKKIISSYKPDEHKPFRVSGFLKDQNSIIALTYASGIYRISEKNHQFSYEKISEIHPIYGGTKVDHHLFLNGKDSLLKVDLNDLDDNHQEMKMVKSPTLFWHSTLGKEYIYASGWGIYEETGGLFKFSKDLKKIDKIPGIASNQIVPLIYTPQEQFLYAGSLDKGLYQISLNPAVEFFPSNHQKIIAIDFFSDSPIRLYNDGLQIGKKKFPSKRFKEEEQKYVYKNIAQLPKHSDFFYEINYDMPAAEIVFYGIKKSNTHIWINTNIGLYKFRPDGNFESYLPLHTLAFDFTFDNKLIETNPYHGTRIYSKEFPLEYKYFDEDSLATPTFIVGTLRKENTTFLLSIFNGLFCYKDGFTSYLNENLWAEKKLRYATNFKNGIAVSQEFGDIYLLDVEPKFKIRKKISRAQLKGNTVSALTSYQDWLIIATERGINFIKDHKHLFVDEEQGLNKPVYSTKVFGDTLFMASDHGEFRINLKKLLNPPKRLDTIYITKFLVNDVIFPWKQPFKLNANQNNIKVSIETNAHPYPDKLSFQYKLKENAKWRNFDSKEIELYFLEPEAYDIYIKVMDFSTGENYEAKVLSFSIASPIYARWWFLLLSGLLLLGGGILFYYYKKKQQEKRAAKDIAYHKQIEKLKTDALLAQMNPHFIFNALNSMQHLVVTGQNEKATDYLVKFAKLVRANLNNAGRTFVTLDEELEYLKMYCDIENMRHDNRISICFEIDATINPLEVNIPTMVLQPFIENAFVHAFSNKIKAPRLIISAKSISENCIEYMIKDNGLGIGKNPKNPERISKGITLIKERLHFLGYDVQKCLIISATEAGMEVKLLL